jgi:2-methylcitrate dehydratase PrpD
VTLIDELAIVVEDAVARPLPLIAVEAAKSRLLHALGVALAGRDLPAVRVAWDAVNDSAGDCVAVARPRRVSDRAAAFHNGVAGHSSLLEDCGPGGLLGGSHPSTYVIPAALAAAESGRVGGRLLILGIVAGYEAVSRLGAAAPDEIVARRFRPIAVMGPFGAAAAAATVHELPRDRLTASLAIAANMSGGISQGFVDGTMEPFLHAGLAASNGLFAARLARAGVTVSPATLEGPFGLFETLGGAQGRPGALTEPRGELAVCTIGTKRFASCVQNQATMEMLLEQAPVVEDAGAVERIVLRRPARGTDGLSSPGVDSAPPYGSMLQRQMSARFTTAAALLRRPVETPSYFADAGGDEPASRLATLVELELTSNGGITLDLYLRGGELITLRSERSRVLFPTASEIRSRFLARAEPLLGETVAAALAEMVDDLEHLADVTELTDLLIQPSKGA